MRIFIASADDRFRLALLMFLDDRSGMSVIGFTDRLSSLLAQLKGSEADVLLLDCTSPVKSIPKLLGDLQDIERRPTTIAFSTRPQEKEAIMNAGADYFIAKDSPPDDLLPILNDIRLSIGSL